MIFSEEASMGARPGEQVFVAEERRSSRFQNGVWLLRSLRRWSGVAWRIRWVAEI